MSLSKVFYYFPADEDNYKSICYLEQIRWKDGVICPCCKSDNTRKNHVRNRAKMWSCRNCKKIFSVTVGTIFHRTRVKINNWIRLISLMLLYQKYKYKLTSAKAAFILEMSQPTVCSMMKRIKKAFETDESEFFKALLDKIYHYLFESFRKIFLGKIG